MLGCREWGRALRQAWLPGSGHLTETVALRRDRAESLPPCGPPPPSQREQRRPGRTNKNTAVSFLLPALGPLFPLQQKLRLYSAAYLTVLGVGGGGSLYS